MKRWKNCAARTIRRAVPSTVSRGPSRPFSCALIGLLALSAASCRSTKTAVRESRTEHVSVVKGAERQTGTLKRWQERVTVPESRVTLRLDADSIKALPQGAGYTARKGQAHVRVSQRTAAGKEKSGQIIIEASCDSLEVQCARYEQRIETMQSQLTAAECLLSTQKQTSKELQLWGFRTILYAFIVGMASGIVSILIIRKYGKKCFRRN